MKAFSQARYIASSAGAADMPPPGPPELAFAGRSNVGKSSAINALTARKRLAFTSKTPGRTQTINFYDLGGAGRLVDLPGYGYAKVPGALREQWRTLVGSYVRSRSTLAFPFRPTWSELCSAALKWCTRPWTPSSISIRMRRGRFATLMTTLIA